jgi:hypothetical protein
VLAARVADAMPALDQDDQRLAIALYRRLAEGEPVAPERLAQEVGIAVERANEILARWPGVYLDARESVVGFWGLTQEPMPPHRFLVDGRELWTWCSWDGLFIPIVLAKRARVESVCATTGDAIWAEVTPTGVAKASPADACLCPRAGMTMAAVALPLCQRESRGGALMPESVDAAALEHLMAQGGQLVEVLPAEEFAEEHLPGARNIPLKELGPKSATQLDRVRPVIVYCWDGL